MPSRPLHFVTLSGVPISISELKWPFHPSTSGADWLVLHGRADLLETSEGLHAEVAVNMTQTMKEALGSLAEEHAEGLVVNSIRKTIDNGQLAFLNRASYSPSTSTPGITTSGQEESSFPRSRKMMPARC